MSQNNELRNDTVLDEFFRPHVPLRRTSKTMKTRIGINPGSNSEVSWKLHVLGLGRMLLVRISRHGFNCTIGFPLKKMNPASSPLGSTLKRKGPSRYSSNERPRNSNWYWKLFPAHSLFEIHCCLAALIRCKSATSFNQLVRRLPTAARVSTREQSIRTPMKAVDRARVGDGN